MKLSLLSKLRLKRTAILIIDMQESFLKYLKDKDYEKIVLNQQRIIESFMSINIPIIIMEYIRHGPTIQKIMDLLKDYNHSVLLEKYYDDAFKDTYLDEELRKLGVVQLIVMGVNASGCVKKTVSSAKKSFYSIITSEDIISNGYWNRQDPDTTPWYIKNTVWIPINEILKIIPSS
jgi:nicotinamidase-related amidase